VVDDTTGHVSVLPEFDAAGPDSTWPAAAPSDSTALEADPVDSIALVADPVDSIALTATGPDTVATAAAGPDTAAVAPAEPSADEPPARESDHIAVARFRAAELYLFQFEDVERARTYYTAVVENHPDDPLAPKAALALGWILETREDDARGARRAYRAIIADYPDSDFSTAAEEGLARLGGAGTD
jgi:tetratricopeptide (TPR) repeat protein